MKLKGKVAVITGSSRGMGKLVALEMAKEGVKVVINGTTPEPVDEVVREIQASGGQAVASYDSVVTMEGGQRIVRTAIDNFGRIDVLVNNAAITRDRSLIKMTEEDWDSVISVDLKGVFTCTKAVLKAGVIAFTKTCAKELGRYNITVNVISPSHKTRMYDNIPDEVFKKIVASRVYLYRLR